MTDRVFRFTVVGLLALLVLIAVGTSVAIVSRIDEFASGARTLSIDGTVGVNDSTPIQVSNTGPIQVWSGQPIHVTVDTPVHIDDSVPVRTVVVAP